MKNKSEERVPLLASSSPEPYSQYISTPPLTPTDAHIYQQDDVNSATLYEKPRTNWKAQLKRSMRCSPVQFIYSIIPVIEWLPKYNWSKDFLYDFLSGVTVAIMHIPQGMAYGLLGNVPPVVGIYMAFFPVLIYFLFGTSRHVSIGTFAIVCLMTGKLVAKHSTFESLHNGNLTNIADDVASQNSYTNIEVATTVTFTVAMMLLIMCIFRLGIITNLLSETLVNGFTCACAFHVVGSQLKDLFGLPVKKRRGYFALLYTIYDAVLAIPDANRTAVSISLVVIVFTVINNEIIKPRLAKKTKIPFPIELVAVVLGTTVSFTMDLNTGYNITIVGHIPTGMPEITPPRLSLIPDILFECLILSIISYAITMSMALIFASKLHYQVNANQELLALSAADLMGSFFCCMPVAASLSRSSIQQAVGGVTQLASVVSSGILLTILLWIGPLFEPLPKCVLASIIVVALKSMLMQCKKLRLFIRMSTWDGMIWIFTFIATVIVSIDIGLAVGLFISLLSLFYRGQHPYTCILGAVPDTELYLDINRFKGALEIPNIKIFHYCGSLNFATKASFKTVFYTKIGFTEKVSVVEQNENNPLMTRCVILDCSALTFIDPAGVEQLRYILSDFSNNDIQFLIASCSGPVFEAFKNCDKHQHVETPFTIFPRVHDAVMFAKMSLKMSKDV